MYRIAGQEEDSDSNGDVGIEWRKDGMEEADEV